MRKKRTRTGKGKLKAKREAGVISPETTPQATSSSNEESLEGKVKRLERELADATLARDFYNEMINVAERQFNIDIRKKLAPDSRDPARKRLEGL